MKYLRIEEVNGDRNLLFCAEIECENVLDLRNFDLEMQNLVCSLCGASTCKQCRRLEHTGKECNQFIDDLFEIYKLDNGIKSCPQCGVDIQKGDGCDHMICQKCKHEFCWQCRRQYVPNTICECNRD